jgi:hypothetical protein
MATSGGQPFESPNRLQIQKYGWKTVICSGWGSALAWSHDSCATVHVQGPSVQILIGRRVLSFLSLWRTSARIERRYTDRNTVLVVLTELGREKLHAARPIHAESVRRNLLSRLNPEQIDIMVRVSNLLGEED